MLNTFLTPEALALQFKTPNRLIGLKDSDGPLAGASNSFEQASEQPA